MTPESETNLLQAAYGPGRASAPRTVIANAAAAMAGAFTVEDLQSAAREQDASIGTATVYRAVAAMVETGFLEGVGERDGATLYARCNASGHHHHLVCTCCGAIAEAPCPLEVYVPALAKRGFVVTDHEVRLYGLCPQCAPDGATKTGGH